MQGIITGIGDKELGKNLIKPEYDAIINDFIIGKNTILEGLELNGNILSAGTCILCGYRGIIEESKTLDTVAYVYGKFTLNFGNGEDSFNIVTSSTALTENVNPTEITSAGTYYLLLYVNGESQIDREHSYPKNSQYSVETKNVLDGAVIESEVEGVTQLENDNSNRIATTQYVHNQIVEEIAYLSKTIDIIDTTKNNDKIGKLTFIRKSKLVVGKVIIDKATQGGIPEVTFSVPEEFYPQQNVLIAFSVVNNLGNWQVWFYTITTTGEVLTRHMHGLGDDVFTLGTLQTFGYQCN